MMEWGDHERFLEGQARRTGKVPHALANKPDIDPHLHLCIECYAMTRGENGIAPLSEIAVFFRMRGGHDLNRFSVLVKGVEAEVLDAQERRRKQEAAKRG